MWDAVEGLAWVNDVRIKPIRSAGKSPQVRFEPSLCAPCNNDRSQPFDRAYQIFSDYVWGRPSLWRARYLDMADVYGPTWQQEVVQLARYVAKHIGCRMAHERFPVPPSLSRFLDGEPLLVDTHMVLFKSRDYYRLYRKGVWGGYDARGLWISPARGAVSRSQQRLTVYSSGLAVNMIGIMYRWEDNCQGVDPFYLYRRARIHQRHKLALI